MVAVYLAAITTFLAYHLFGYGLRHTPAQFATILTLAEPAAATVLGITALGITRRPSRLPHPVFFAGAESLGSGRRAQGSRCDHLRR